MLIKEISRLARLPLFAAGSIALSACTVGSNEVEEGVVVGDQALGATSFKYLRCNATGWGVDAATLLTETGTPNVFSLTFTVDEPWMTQSGDQCTLLETNELNGWGTWQRAFTSASSSPLSVPGTTPITPGWQYFNVLFPEQGEYTATLDGSTLTIAPSTAPEPTLVLDWPLAGAQGSDWVINNYVDLDPSTGVLDYHGGARSYDGHLGVDIDVSTFREMDGNVPILAAAPGTVIALAESNPDRNTSCVGDWNFVTVRTEEGYELIYGHMKRDSVVVSVGQQVSTGDTLGVVGSSGCSTQPHLHLEIRDPSGTVISPFAEGLWRNPPPYETPLTIMDFVLTDQAFSSYQDVIDPPPNETTLQWGDPGTIGLSVAGTVPGDQLDVRILRPDGTTYYSSVQDVSNDWPHSFWYWPFSVNALQGPEGTYTLEVRANGDLQVVYPFEIEAP